jgi:drug/metabolite transporter (DMT)-like permease
MSAPSTRLLLRAAPLTFAVLWSLGFIVAKYAAPDADPFAFLTARFGLAALILGVFAWSVDARWPTTRAGIAHSAISGMLMHGGYLAGIWWAVFAGLPASIAGLLAAGQPLLTAVLAGPLLGERVGWRHWAGIAAGFIGIVMVLLPRLAGVDAAALPGIAIPMIVAALGVLSVTLGTFYQKRFVPSTDLRTGTCVQYIGALALMLPMTAALGSWRFDPTLSLLIALAVSVLGLSVAGIGLLLMMIRYGEVSRVAVLIYLVPPLTAIEAYLLFGESFNTVQVVGMVAATAGVWLATR